MSTIVVGLDVSRSSAAALRWAADYAMLTGGALVAVHAMPVTAALASVGVLGMPAPSPPVTSTRSTGETSRRCSPR